MLAIWQKTESFNNYIQAYKIGILCKNNVNIASKEFFLFDFQYDIAKNSKELD